VDSSTSAKTQRGLTRDRLDRLLFWLDQDRDRAADKYEEIRIRLIKMFETRGCAIPEDLTDETIDRVARKLDELAATYEGNPALYFHGVARLVHLEYLRQRPRLITVPSPADPAETEQLHECLDRCLNRLSPRNRELILQYYEDEPQPGSDARKELARRLGISPNAVRIRTHRIRESLGRCVRDCLTMRNCK
jgi:RNA polymerase sigma-70 factor (ECF subfamily)